MNENVNKTVGDKFCTSRSNKKKTIKDLNKSGFKTCRKAVYKTRHKKELDFVTGGAIGQPATTKKTKVKMPKHSPQQKPYLRSSVVTPKIATKALPSKYSRCTEKPTKLTMTHERPTKLTVTHERPTMLLRSTVNQEKPSKFFKASVKFPRSFEKHSMKKKHSHNKEDSRTSETTRRSSRTIVKPRKFHDYVDVTKRSDTKATQFSNTSNEIIEISNTLNETIEDSDTSNETVEVSNNGKKTIEPETMDKVDVIKQYDSLAWTNGFFKGKKICRVAKAFKSYESSVGFLSIKGYQTKKSQHLPKDNIVFIVIKGSVHVKINNVEAILAENDAFHVPMCAPYSIENICEEDALLNVFTSKYHLHA